MAKGNSTFNISLKLLTQQFNKGVKDVQRQIKGLGNFIKGAFAIGSITAFGRQVVQVASEFEDSMARVRAVSNASNQELKTMADEARRLGASTKFTASEAANALENLTRNGMSAGDATKSLAGVLQLAQANAIGLAEAADILTNTLNAFGLAAKDTSRVNDVLSVTCANSATNVSLLYEAMIGVGPIAKIMGKSIEETAAALGVLANKGVKGSEAGKALGAMYQRLASQSPQAEKALVQYGLKIDESKLKSQSFQDTLQELADSGIGNSIEALSKVFGKNYAKTIASLINDTEAFNQMLGKTQDAAGTTARMFKQGVGTTKEALATLNSAYQALLEQLGSRTSGVFNSIIKGLTNIVNALQNTKTAVATVISAVVIALNVKLSKAMLKVRTEASKTGVVLAGLKGTITALKTVIQGAYAAMGGWVGILITIASVALPGIINKIEKHNDEVREMADAEASATAEARKEEIVLRKLYDIAKDETKSITLRKKALDEIKSTVKEYHGVISEEGKLENDNTEAIGKYCEALKAKMVLQTREARLQKLIQDREIAAAEALAAETAGPSFWDKLASFYSGMSGGTATGNYSTPIAQSAEQIHDKRVEKLQNKVSELDKKIDEYTDTEIKSAIEAVQEITNSLNTGGGGGGGNGKSDLEKAKEHLAEAITEYTHSISIAAKKYDDKLLTKDEYDQEVLNAEKSLIDAYYDASEKVTDSNVLEQSLFKTVLASYKERLAASKASAAAEATNKKLIDEQNRRLDNISKTYYESRKDFKEAEAQSKNKNPWEGFSTNVKEYKDEQLALQELEDELGRVQRAYDELADDIGLLESAGTEEAKQILGWLQRLEAALPELKDKVAAARNELYSKKAKDDIVQLDKDRVSSYYGAIKQTTSAVQSLTSAFESLSNMKDMSFAERFATLSNAIFGTIDAIASCIESFNSLFKIMDNLALAQKKYAEISAQASAQNIANTEAEATANLTTAATQVAKGEAAETAAVQTATAATTEVAANTGVAVTGAAASQAGIPYVGPILAAAAVAGILALLAASIPKFASGGIVQGSSKYGDKLLARVNAGEAILNQRQQKRLLDIADGRVGGSMGNVSFHIAGKDLVGVLRNNNAANAKIAGAKGM